MKRSLQIAFFGVAGIALPLLGGCQVVAQKAAETVIKRMGGTLDAAERAPANVDASYVQSLAPLASGSGLIVCEPVPVAALASAANWGTGAARWLQVQVAGQPELGKTPLWGVPENARIRLGYPDLRLDAKRADALGRSCGTSHVAVGTLSGTPAAAVLTYQLREVKTEKIVGTAEISGPVAQLNAQLPGLARQLATQLEVKAALPTQIALSADEIAFLGAPKLKATYRGDHLAPADLARLKTIASKDVLASVMALRWGNAGDDKLRGAIAASLLKNAPDNALAWGEMAYWGPQDLDTASAKLALLQAKYPNSYLLAEAGLAVERDNNGPLQVSWAEKAVRAAPGNSYAWNDLAKAQSHAAQALRRSRYSRDISRAEWKKLHVFYARYQATALKSTRVEPKDSYAWSELAQGATFNSDSAGAVDALEKSLALDPRNLQAWEWGMEMMQPKWGGDMNGFVAFTARAANHAADFYFPARDVKDVFSSNGQGGAVKGILQTVAAKDPNNPEVLTELGAIYHYEDRSYKKAEALYRRALSADPNYALAASTLGDLTYWVHRDPQGAEALYRQAIASEPKDGYFHANLGRLYALTGRKARGIAEANAAVKLGFRDKSHPVWDATGVQAPGRW